MAGISNIIGLWEALASADLAVSQHRCVVVRNRHAQCRRCAEACTTGCIAVEAGQLQVDRSKCIGCGTCATVCPAGALEPQLPNDGELLASCLKAADKAGGVAVIACDRACHQSGTSVDGERVVGLTCLGRIEEDLLLALADADVRTVRLVCADCDECPLACGAAVSDEVIATATALLEAWGIQSDIQRVAGLPAEAFCPDQDSYGPSRRRALSMLKQDLKATARVAASAALDDALGSEPPSKDSGAADVVMVAEDGTLPHFVPGRRQRMLDRLRRWERPANTLVETRLWGNVIVDAHRCQSCRMCAVFCPTGSLARAEKDHDGFFGLKHRPAICVRCGTCESVCPEGALIVAPEVFTDDVIDDFVEPIELREPAHERVGPHSALHAMRNVLGNERVYDR